MMTKEDFGKKIKKLRRQNGFSARQLSKELGFNSSYFSTIENGEAYPSMQRFLLICEQLGIEPADFFAMEM